MQELLHLWTESMQKYEAGNCWDQKKGLVEDTQGNRFLNSNTYWQCQSDPVTASDFWRKGSFHAGPERAVACSHRLCSPGIWGIMAFWQPGCVSTEQSCALPGRLLSGRMNRGPVYLTYSKDTSKRIFFLPLFTLICCFLSENLIDQRLSLSVWFCSLSSLDFIA